jgi:hypothetical protein
MRQFVAVRRAPEPSFLLWSMARTPFTLMHQCLQASVVEEVGVGPTRGALIDHGERFACGV